MRRLPTIAAARATKHIAKTSHIKDELIMATPSNPQTAQCNTNWDAVKVAMPIRLDDCGPAMEPSIAVALHQAGHWVQQADLKTNGDAQGRVTPAVWGPGQVQGAGKHGNSTKRDALFGHLLRLVWGSLSMNTCDRNDTPGCHPLRPATERSPTNQSGSFTPTRPTH